MKDSKKHSGNKGLWILLSALCLMICGLVVGIIVVVNNEANTLRIETCEEATSYLYEGFNADDMKAFLAKSEEMLAATDDVEIKVCIYSDRFSALYNNMDGSDEYMAQMMSDAYALEEIKQDASSAYNIYKAEIMAGNIDKADEWQKIAEDRGMANRTGSG